MQIIVKIFLFVILIATVVSIFSMVGLFLLVALSIHILYRIVREIKKNKYFNSGEFLEHKAKIDSTINEYNEISEYIKEIPDNSQFIPRNSENDQGHLATFENTSNHNYIRDRKVKTSTDENIYSASLHIVRKASEQPIKYLCKYFGIKATKENLEELQNIGNDVSRMENTIDNLQQRLKQIEGNLNPPKFILKHYHKDLMEKIGVQIPKLKIEYAEYIFEYISAGGNSSQRSRIVFDAPTIEATSEYVSKKIKYLKSAKRQRALMTNSLRTTIKERDNYTCKMCSVSVMDQSLLLLEIDHIIPVSKGGMSTDDNLQTLCWKCNRTKSDKIL